MSDHNNNRLFWLRPAVVRVVVYVLYAVCALSVILEFVIHRHEKLDFAASFGFYAWYGFAGCVGLVIAAKGLRRLLMQPEDYYEAPTEQANREPHE